MQLFEVTKDRVIGMTAGWSEESPALAFKVCNILTDNREENEEAASLQQSRKCVVSWHVGAPYVPYH